MTVHYSDFVQCSTSIQSGANKLVFAPIFPLLLTWRHDASIFHKLKRTKFHNLDEQRCCKEWWVLILNFIHNLQVLVTPSGYSDSSYCINNASSVVINIRLEWYRNVIFLFIMYTVYFEFVAHFKLTNHYLVYFKLTNHYLVNFKLTNHNLLISGY